jgi:hypothetical protein
VCSHPPSRASQPSSTSASLQGGSTHSPVHCSKRLCSKLLNGLIGGSDRSSSYPCLHGKSWPYRAIPGRALNGQTRSPASIMMSQDKKAFQREKKQPPPRPARLVSPVSIKILTPRHPTCVRIQPCILLSTHTYVTCGAAHASPFVKTRREQNDATAPSVYLFKQPWTTLHQP